jgi:hypothetical protein
MSEPDHNVPESPDLGMPALDVNTPAAPQPDLTAAPTAPTPPPSDLRAPPTVSDAPTDTEDASGS